MATSRPEALQGQTTIRSVEPIGSTIGSTSGSPSGDAYRWLAEYATDLISSHDPSGTFRYASPSARAILGEDPQALIGRNIMEFVDEEGLDTVDDDADSIPFVDALSERKTWCYRVLRGDGKFVWLESRFHVVRDDPEKLPVAIVAVTRDVTRRVALERALARRNRELDAFAAMVCHDLKGPIVAAAARIGELEEQAQEDPSVTLASCMEQIDGIAQRIDGLLPMIDGVMGLARGDLDPKRKSRVPLAELARNVANELASVAERHAIQIHVDEVEPVAIDGHEKLLEQAVVNLVANALRHGAPGRAQNVRIRGRYVTDERSEAVYELAVDDDGPGLPADLDSPRPRDAPEPGSAPRWVGVGARRCSEEGSYGYGLGIGLTIVDRVVAAHGAFLDTGMSREGGASFRIRFPAGIIHRIKDDRSRGLSNANPASKRRNPLVRPSPGLRARSL